MAVGATVDVTVRLQELGGTWQTCGTGRAIKVLPESVTYSHNEWGADKASFSLHRSPIAIWPDLGAFTPVEIEIGGVVVWEGRTDDTPLRSGSEPIINVQCQGDQYRLDDDVYQRTYVHSKLTDWRDTRSYPECPLTFYRTSGSVQVQQGRIAIGYAKGAIVASLQGAGVTLDLGPATSGAVYVSVDAELVGNGEGFQFYAICHNSFTLGAELWVERLDAVSASALGTGNYQGAIASPRRYISLMVYRNGAEVTQAADMTLVIKAVKIFTDATFKENGAGFCNSILKASTVVKDAVERATKLLSADYSGITASTFSIPDFALSKMSTPREAIEAANAYHNWVAKIEPGKRVAFRARPTSPVLEIGAWAGTALEDASANSGAEIYNRAIIEAAGPDGSPLVVERTAGTPTLVDRRGFRRSKVIQMSSAITATEGNQLADIFLQAHDTTPFKGSATASPGAVRRIVGGQLCHPSQLGLHTQELLRLSHLIDPDTGAVGRDATIAEVTYTHKDQKAQITLDDKRQNFDALLARLAVVQTPGS